MTPARRTQSEAVPSQTPWHCSGRSRRCPGAPRALWGGAGRAGAGGASPAPPALPGPARPRPGGRCEAARGGDCGTWRRPSESRRCGGAGPSRGCGAAGRGDGTGRAGSGAPRPRAARGPGRCFGARGWRRERPAGTAGTACARRGCRGPRPLGPGRRCRRCPGGLGSPGPGSGAEPPRPMPEGRCFAWLCFAWLRFALLLTLARCRRVGPCHLLRGVAQINVLVLGLTAPCPLCLCGVRSCDSLRVSTGEQDGSSP